VYACQPRCMRRACVRARLPQRVSQAGSPSLMTLALLASSFPARPSDPVDVHHRCCGARNQSKAPAVLLAQAAASSAMDA
jgi:hypothetical protein